MDGIVTLNQLLNIKDLIADNSKSYSDDNELLEDYVLGQYDTIHIREKLLKLFADFKSARYLYDFPLDENIKITSSTNNHEVFTQKDTTSHIEKAIEKYIDKQLLTTDIYNSIIKVSYKLTNDEVLYLTYTFLTYKSEEYIAELIGISKSYLQKIKKSCLIKLWTELKKYCKEDD